MKYIVRVMPDAENIVKHIVCVIPDAENIVEYSVVPSDQHNSR